MTNKVANVIRGLCVTDVCAVECEFPRSAFVNSYEPRVPADKMIPIRLLKLCRSSHVRSYLVAGCWNPALSGICNVHISVFNCHKSGVVD